MKKGLMILMLVFLIPLEVFAAEPIQIIFNGSVLETSNPPLIERGRVLVPIRVITESFKGEVIWDNKTKSLTANKGDISIKATVGENMVYRNAYTVELDVPVKIVKGRVYVPLRFISESFGEVVNWRDDNNTVVLLTQDFIQTTTNDLINKIETTLESQGIEKANRILYENFNEWRNLLDEFTWFKDVGGYYHAYEFWIPENNNKCFVVRIINRYLTSDDYMYSDTWINASPAPGIKLPVRDMIACIDLSNNKFNVNWVGYLTNDKNQISRSFDNGVLDQAIKGDLDTKLVRTFYENDKLVKVEKDFTWGWVKTYGQKPEFSNIKLIHYTKSYDQIAPEK